MRRLLTVVLVGAIGSLVVAATAVELWPSGNAPVGADRGRLAGAPAPIPSGSSSQATALPRCKRDQLALSFEVLGGDQVVALRHVRGKLCDRAGLLLALTVTDREGNREQLPLAPEGGVLNLSGDFSPGFEEVEGFNYMPRCGQRGPFVATARAGGYSARRTIAAAPTCRPAIDRTVVRLRAGRDAAAFAIQALDPPTHTFTVRVVLPRAATVAITMRTPSGLVLHVLDQLRRQDCHRRGAQDVCIYHFEALEGQQGGEWIVSVRKKSPEPATVRFRIRFEPVR